MAASKPSPEAMAAARGVIGCYRQCRDVACETRQHNVATALDAFAAKAVEAERQAIIRYICTTHFHEDDLLEFIRARSTAK